MAGFSNFVEKRVLDFLFKKNKVTSGGADQWAPPTALHVSLHSGDPGDTGANELSATGSYARAQLDPDVAVDTNTNWNATDQSAAASKMTNKAAISFPTATADWNSGAAITFWGLWDAATNGNFLLGGAITPSGVVVLNGNTLSFAGGSPGQLSFTLD